MTNDNPAMAGPTQEVCLYNEPHAWSTQMGSHLPSVQVCMVCQTVNRKDIQVQIDNEKAQSYGDGWQKGRARGLEQGKEEGWNSAQETLNRMAQEALLNNEKVVEARRIAYKQGLYTGIHRGADVANQANARADEGIKRYWTEGAGSAPVFPSAPEQPAAMNEAQGAVSQSPSTPQAPHRCARFMIVAFNDGTDFRVDFSRPIAERGWKVRKINGVEMLIIGHGIPRKMFPICNIKYMDLVPEDYL